MSFVKRIVDKVKYGEPIVVVSGLPRSGTSMCMKMLDAAGIEAVQDGIRTADVDNPKGYFEHERVKELDKPGADKSWVKNHRGSAIKVISFLLEHLPNDNHYKVVFLRRNIEEVLASQAKMLDHRNEDNTISDEEMTKIYENHLLRTKSILSARENFEVVYVHYTEILTDPRPEAQKIAEFLGVEDKAEAMAAAVDPKLWRNRAGAKK
ncbi:MAG: sulfotransferase family protein [Gemmatimonadetes bacterium]|nr:sulfotransferase family protein [Gemmatimonadota bacterium]